MKRREFRGGREGQEREEKGRIGRRMGGYEEV